jgi:hypothetical protein
VEAAFLLEEEEEDHLLMEPEVPEEMVLAVYRPQLPTVPVVEVEDRLGQVQDLRVLPEWMDTFSYSGCHEQRIRFSWTR